MVTREHTSGLALALLAGSILTAAHDAPRHLVTERPGASAAGQAAADAATITVAAELPDEDGLRTSDRCLACHKASPPSPARTYRSDTTGVPP